MKTAPRRAPAEPGGGWHDGKIQETLGGGEPRESCSGAHPRHDRFCVSRARDAGTEKGLHTRCLIGFAPAKSRTSGPSLPACGGRTQASAMPSGPCSSSEKSLASSVFSVPEKSPHHYRIVAEDSDNKIDRERYHRFNG